MFQSPVWQVNAHLKQVRGRLLQIAVRKLCLHLSLRVSIPGTLTATPPYPRKLWESDHFSKYSACLLLTSCSDLAGALLVPSKPSYERVGAGGFVLFCSQHMVISSLR